jgi:hypothetical protein
MQPHSAEERRHGESAVPPHLNSYLTQEQVSALQKIENFGWHLAFVRRPMFQAALTVLQNSDHPDRYAVLMEDGEMDFSPQIVVRA